MKVKVDIVTSDDIKAYYTAKFQDFTARYIIKTFVWLVSDVVLTLHSKITMVSLQKKFY